MFRVRMLRRTSIRTPGKLNSTDHRLAELPDYRGKPVGRKPNPLGDGLQRRHNYIRNRQLGRPLQSWTSVMKPFYEISGNRQTAWSWA